MDREKVVKGLECCTGLGCHHGCEYLNNGCTELLKKDALALLKEQEAVVRCKDCKWYKNFECENDNISRMIDDCGCGSSFKPNSDWFCAEGVKKDESEG